MVLLIVGFTLIFGVVHLYKHEHKKDKFDSVSKVHGRKIPEHIHVDYNNQIIYASNDADGEIDGLVALHNYDKKMLAFKDLTNGRCYIDVLDETFEEGLTFWSAQEGKERTLVTRYFRYIREPIDLDVLRTFAGQHIADHCAGVPSHWIVVISKEEAERQEKSANGKTVQFICRPNYECPKCPTDVFPVTSTEKPVKPGLGGSEINPIKTSV
ncbi:hypothetical protein SNE40_020637 [Patella caerulea]|uniref:BRICHOS domain-containing protein n=1 Tax=Patella caerulea TaxID=87958 RepID=A0AAN8P7L3_PATCE